MAKKSKDLFQLLQKRRSKGSFKIAPEPETREPFDPVGVVADWFRGLTSGSPTRRKRKRKAPTAGQRAAGILVTGPTMAGLVFGSLAVGFLLGGGLASEAPEDLSAGVEGTRPDWVPPAAESGVLSTSEQMAVLGSHSYLLGVYPTGGDQHAARARAEKLATYLRSQGLKRTRIYKHWADGGDTLWVTLYYTESPVVDGIAAIDQGALDRIRAVEPPDFEPRWASFVGQLAKYPQPVTLKRP